MPHNSHLRQLATACAYIMAGCMVNNLVLEVIVSKKKNEWADPGAGGLMTLLQFLLVAALSSPHAIRWRGLWKGGPGGGVSTPTAAGDSASNLDWPVKSPSSGDQGWSVRFPLAMRPMVVPLRHYLGMTALFFTMSYLNNWAFAFNISQPLHMVFRSSALMVAYVIGALFLGKR